MKTLLVLLGIFTFLFSIGQTRVTEEIVVNNQKTLDLDFAFADEIEISVWEKDQVFVEVEVTINDGEDDDLFALEKRTSESVIYFRMDKDRFESKEYRKKNCWDMDINYKVYLPRSLRIRAETISGNYTLRYYGQELDFKTISGDVDLTIPRDGNVEFKVKTISGEVYSDLDIRFPEGKAGLRQVVGMNVKGMINEGGNLLDLETISGNIFLRGG